MSHADDFPEHSRTSCSDQDPCNADPQGHGCWRCNALLFDRLERAVELIREGRDALVRSNDTILRIGQENEQFRTLEEKACTTVYLDLREELGLQPEQSLIEAVMAIRRRAEGWKQIAISMHAHPDWVRTMDRAGMEEAIRSTARYSPRLAAFYTAMLEEMP